MTDLGLTVVRGPYTHVAIGQYSCQLVCEVIWVDLIYREIYQNQTDGGVYGSLLWLLDQ